MLAQLAAIFLPSVCLLCEEGEDGEDDEEEGDGEGEGVVIKEDDDDSCCCSPPPAPGPGTLDPQVWQVICQALLDKS